MTRTPKQIRARLGMTQTVLGDILGVHPMTVSKWERERDVPSLYHTQLLEAFYIATCVDEHIGEAATRLYHLYMSPVEPLTALLMAASRAIVIKR